MPDQSAPTRRGPGRILRVARAARCRGAGVVAGHRRRRPDRCTPPGRRPARDARQPFPSARRPAWSPGWTPTATVPRERSSTSCTSPICPGTAARSAAIRGVSAANPSGHGIGPGPAGSRGPVRTITLNTGATAAANLGIVEALNFPRALCGPTTAAGLRVFAPGATRAKFVPFPFAACTHHVSLRISPVAAHWPDRLPDRGRARAPGRQPRAVAAVARRAPGSVAGSVSVGVATQEQMDADQHAGHQRQRPQRSPGRSAWRSAPGRHPRSPSRGRTAGSR